ncbi:MAG: hypothetical protein KDB47_16115 [Mycobacterium sp.]|nr:hypothetical protein [Mycobacterium sp.]
MTIVTEVGGTTNVVKFDNTVITINIDTNRHTRQWRVRLERTIFSG